MEPKYYPTLWGPDPKARGWKPKRAWYPTRNDGMCNTPRGDFLAPFSTRRACREECDRRNAERGR